MKKTQSAGGVVLNSTGEVLVVNQRGVSWSLPKGHVDDGEDILAAAKREIYEESGVNELILVKKLGTVRRNSMATNSEEMEDKTIHYFLFKTTQMKLAPIDPHNPEARWMSVEEAGKILTNEKDREFFLSHTTSFTK